MAFELRERLSKITEIYENNDGDAVTNFFAAIGWAIPAGSVTFMIASLAIEPFGFGAALSGILFLSIFVAIFAFLGMLLIGLPVTWLLALAKAESVCSYTSLGAITGAFVVATTFEAWRVGGPFLFLLGGSGAAAGIACGLRWGLWRAARMKSDYGVPD